MEDRRGKPNPPSDTPGATTIVERRRIGRIVHDERGNARVEWVHAADDAERVSLSLEETQSIYKPERGYDPYQKSAKAARAGTPSPGRSAPADRSPTKRDLRKLSEWIKQKREIEARKQRGDDIDED